MEEAVAGVFIPLNYLIAVIAALAMAVSTLFALWRKDRAAMEARYTAVFAEKKSEAETREARVMVQSDEREAKCRACWEKWEKKIVGVLYDYHKVVARIADLAETGGEERR